MSTTSVREVTWRGGTINWKAHACGLANSAGPLLATPVASWISAGLGAVTAGVSIYSAFQLKKQEQILRNIDSGLKGLRDEVRHVARELDDIHYRVRVLDYKVDAILKNVQRLEDLVRETQTKVDELVEIKNLEWFVVKGLEEFERLAKNGALSLGDLQSLEDDFRTSLDVILRNTKEKRDIRLPSWVVSRWSDTFLFFRVLNLFLIESHNILSRYDPMETRRYLSLERSSPRGGVFLADGGWQDLIELREWYSMARKKPRASYLVAFLWEIRQARLQLETSPVLSGNEERVLCLPALNPAGSGPESLTG